MAHDPQKLIFNVARRIAELRKEEKLTQDELAAKLGATGGYVRLLESGKQNVTVATISKLAHYLNCDPKNFFETPTSDKSGPGRPPKSKKK